MDDPRDCRGGVATRPRTIRAAAAAPSRPVLGLSRSGVRTDRAVGSRAQVQLSPNVFVQRWATLGAPGLEHMATFAASAGPATAAFAKTRLVELVRVAVVDGVDDGGGTIMSGATALRTGTVNAGGEKISVGCLVRLEMNEAAGAFRLTVRTAVPHVSTALSEAIQKLL